MILPRKLRFEYVRMLRNIPTLAQMQQSNQDLNVQDRNISVSLP